MQDVVTLGEAMVLLAAAEPGPLVQVKQFTKHTAGAETNVAGGLARLGYRVSWFSRLGDDSIGHYLRACFEDEGIDCSQVEMVAGGKTGMMFKTLSVAGDDPTIEYHRKDSAASQLRADDVDWARFEKASHLHTTGIYPALTPNTLEVTQSAMERMRSNGKSVSFDPNLRPALWPNTEAMRTSINALAAKADWVFPGLQEGQLLTGKETPAGIATFYRAQGAQCVVVKLGDAGAYYDSDSGVGMVPAFPVSQIVDTVGAGDAFAVGVISGLLEKLPLQKAVERAAWMGARATQVRGDCEGLPSREELIAADF
jgi:2-dehydro-3-deoxygluconokinase